MQSHIYSESSQRSNIALNQMPRRFLTNAPQHPTFEQINEPNNTLNEIRIKKNSKNTKHTNNKKITFRQTQNVKSQQNIENKNSVYKNIQIIRKVATFMENCRLRIVKENKKLNPIELFYLQNQCSQQQPIQRLISWENPLFNAFQVIVCIIISLSIWTHTQQIFQNLKPFFIATYLIWILLKLNTQVKTQSVSIIAKRKQIFVKYLQKEFVFEAISIFSLTIQIFQIDALFYPERILFLVSIFTFWNLLSKIQEVYTYSQEIQRFIIILKLIFRILVFLHCLALALILMSRIQLQFGVTETWISKNRLEEVSSFEKYINGYYWSATTISTVGYGDITPANSVQKLVISFVQVFCCLFYGYCINIIGNTIGLIGETTQKHVKQSRRLNRYLKNLQVSNSIKNKIKQHFFNRHKIQQAYDQQSEIQIFSKIDQSMQNQIRQGCFISVIEKSKFLNRFSDQIKKKLANSVQKKIYAPNQKLFDESTQDIKLYLVDTGIIKQYCFESVNSNKPIAEYHKQDNTLGWNNLITGNKYRSHALAQGFALVYQINRALFLQIISKNRRDMDKLCEVKQKMLQKKIKFKKDCFVCKKLTHNVVQCPQIHYIPRPIYFMLTSLKKQISVKNLRINNYLRKKRNQFLVLIQSESKTILRSSIRQSFQAFDSQAFMGNFKQNQVAQRNRQKTLSIIKNNSNLQNNSSQNKLNRLIIGNQKSGSLFSIKQQSFSQYLDNQVCQFTNKNKKQFDQSFDKVIFQMQQNFFSQFNQKKILQKMKMDNKQLDEQLQQGMIKLSLLSMKSIGRKGTRSEIRKRTGITSRLDQSLTKYQQLENIVL